MRSRLLACIVPSFPRSSSEKQKAGVYLERCLFLLPREYSSTLMLDHGWTCGIDECIQDQRWFRAALAAPVGSFEGVKTSEVGFRVQRWSSFESCVKTLQLHQPAESRSSVCEQAERGSTFSCQVGIPEWFKSDAWSGQFRKFPRVINNTSTTDILLLFYSPSVSGLRLPSGCAQRNNPKSTEPDIIWTARAPAIILDLLTGV